MGETTVPMSSKANFQYGRDIENAVISANRNCEEK